MRVAFPACAVAATLQAIAQRSQRDGPQRIQTATQAHVCRKLRRCRIGRRLRGRSVCRTLGHWQVAAPKLAGLRDAPRVLRLLLARLEAYEPTCVRVVHGDAWFANILLDEGSGGDNDAAAIGEAATVVPPSLQPPEASAPCALRFVDMRGCIGGELTLNGDPLYDFAKLLQSLVGFDEAVFDLPTVPPGYRAGRAAWRRYHHNALPHGGLDPFPRTPGAALASRLRAG